MPSDNLDVTSSSLGNNRRDLRKAKSKELEVSSDGSVQDSTHPLLAPELLEIKDGFEGYASYSIPKNNTGASGDTEEDSTSQMIGAFGILTVDNRQYVGLSGASAPEVCPSSFCN